MYIYIYTHTHISIFIAKTNAWYLRLPCFRLCLVVNHRPWLGIPKFDLKKWCKKYVLWINAFRHLTSLTLAGCLLVVMLDTWQSEQWNKAETTNYNHHYCHNHHRCMLLMHGLHVAQWSSGLSLAPQLHRQLIYSQTWLEILVSWNCCVCFRKRFLLWRCPKMMAVPPNHCPKSSI